MRHGEWCCRVDDSCAEIAAICNEQGLEAIFSDCSEIRRERKWTHLGWVGPLKRPFDAGNKGRRVIPSSEPRCLFANVESLDRGMNNGIIKYVWERSRWL